jgi:hypothetical protein
MSEEEYVRACLSNNDASKKVIIEYLYKNLSPGGIGTFEEFPFDEIIGGRLTSEDVRYMAMHPDKRFADYLIENDHMEDGLYHAIFSVEQMKYFVEKGAVVLPETIQEHIVEYCQFIPTDCIKYVLSQGVGSG